MTARATVKIKAEPSYRRHAFVAGLQKAGFEVGEFAQPKSRHDMLVLWNRMGVHETEANDWEARGGTVVVAENGYMGRDATGQQFYAISVHGHNGAGWFYQGDDDRFAALGIELKPWNSKPDGYILLCAQRGIGSKQMASPPRWDATTAGQLMRMGHRNLKVRQHPGRVKSETTLEQDLEGARCAVIWSSASGVRALQLGVPVIYTAPHWVASEAATHGLGTISSLRTDDAARLRALQHAAWGQWSVAEIEAGTPFHLMLEHLWQAKW